MKLLKPVFYFFLFIISSLHAQEIPFTFVGDKLGLPANECYNVMQDSKGYIWISTEAGLCRYNGSFCRIFDKNNGLPENATYTVQEDNTTGKIWITTSANRILNFWNDSLVEVPFSKNYAALQKNTVQQAYILTLLNDSVVINSQGTTYTTGKNSTALSVLNPTAKAALNFTRTDNKLFLVLTVTNGELISETTRKGYVLFSINDKVRQTMIKVPFYGNDSPDWRVLLASCKDEYLIGFGNILIKLHPDNKYSVYRVPFPIISLYCDKDSGLWVGTVNGGVFYYPDMKTMTNPVNSLSGFSVSGTCVDHENNVWCTTLEKGVFYCRNKNVVNYGAIKGLDKPADILKLEHGRLFTSTRNNELIELKNDTILRYPIALDGNYPVSDILRTEKTWIICGKTFLAETDGGFHYFKCRYSPGTRYYIGANQLAYTPEGRLFIIQTGGLREVLADKISNVQKPLESGGKCLHYAGNNILLYGCTEGLYQLNLVNNISVKIKGITGIVKIIRTSFGETWVITRQNGIYRYTEGKAENITNMLALPADRLFDITEDRYGTIWIATNIGLLKIKKSGGKYFTQLYTTLNGLLTNKISSIAADSNNLYLSGIDGLYKFPLSSELINSSIPQIHIRTFSVNGIPYSYLQPLELEYYNNSVSVEVDALTFKEINAPTLFYDLTGIKDPSQRNGVINGNTISLDNLPPGNYELRIYAVNNNGIKSDKPVILRFQIKNPFWQTAWFIVVSALLLCLIIYVSVKTIVSRIRKKEEEKTSINKRLAEFQLTALQAQMNPHFIFNAINSIQGYILKKNEQLAYNYLAKFSKLIRMVLTNSQEKSLPLKQELEMLIVYIELEQLRFDQSFEFILTIDEHVNQYETFVPTMLIQPYVENAIWHGLMNLEKDKKGILRIDIRLDGNMLKITVEDNGIGREEAKVYAKQNNHNSIGMKLTEQRLNMINALQNYESSKVRVNDVLDEENKVIGTRVEIFIPADMSNH